MENESKSLEEIIADTVMKVLSGLDICVGGEHARVMGVSGVTFDDQRKPKRRFDVNIQWKAKEGNDASEKQVVINTDAQQTYRKFRVVAVTNNLADYPEDAADTAEFPDLVERIEDEEEVFVVEEGVDFWPAGEFFFMQDIREFLVPCKKD